MNLSEISEQPDGMPIGHLVAKVKYADPIKRGEGARGPWAFMPLKLSDGADLVRVTWFDPTIEDPNELRGQTVTIAATKNGRNQLSGAKVEHREFQGKKEITIQVTGSHLTLGDSVPVGAPEEATEAPKVTRRVSSRPSVIDARDFYQEALGFLGVELEAVPVEERAKAAITMLIAFLDGRLEPARDNSGIFG